MDAFEITSVVVAGSALGLTVWQARVARHHAQLSVQPLLSVQLESGEKRNAVSLANVGLGPAVITSFSFVSRSGEDSLVAIGDELERVGVDTTVNLFAPGSVVDRDKTTPIVAGDDPLSMDQHRKFWFVLQRAEIRVGYKSMYGIGQPELRYTCSATILGEDPWS